MSEQEFTSEQVFNQAQVNLTAFIFGTIAYLKEQGRTAEEWATFLGSLFAPSWESVKGQGAMAAMQAAVLNGLSIGASLHSLTGDEAQAEAVVIDGSLADALEAFGLTQEDVDLFSNAFFKSVAAYLNLRYEWQRAGNQVIFRFSRQSTPS